MNTIKVFRYREIPKNFTGIAEWPNGTKEWIKDGKLHRTDGPAVEKPNGDKSWFIKGHYYSLFQLLVLFKTSVFLEKKQKDKHNLDWLRFLTEKGIEEFPVIPGMEQDNNFKLLFNQLFGATIK